MARQTATHTAVDVEMHKGGTAPDVTALASAHEEVTRVAGCLRPCASTRRHTTSVHECGSPLHFGAVRDFIDRVASIRSKKQCGATHIGTIDGVLTISVRLLGHGHPRASVKSEGLLASNPPERRKRPRDTAADRAFSVVAAARAHMSGEEPTALAIAEHVITQLLSAVRGADGEQVVEACALTVGRHPTAAPSPPMTPPRLLIVCQLCAGVAVPLESFMQALGPCATDGLFTTDYSKLSNEFRLLPTVNGRLLEAANGQQGALCFATVPCTKKQTL